MNKTDLMLQMMEHPQAYSSDEWKQILLDDECRELYTLMSKTRSAINSARVDEQITDEVIDDEWQQFEAQHLVAKHQFSFRKMAASLTFGRACSHSGEQMQASLSSRLAASFIGLLLVSGIALAAVHIVRQAQKPATPQPEQTVITDNTPDITPADTLTADTIVGQSVTFDNVLFDKMLSEIAEYYHAEVVFQNEEARQLRFYFVWYQDQALDKVVETLNHFESVNIIMDDKKLIVQ